MGGERGAGSSRRCQQGLGGMPLRGRGTEAYGFLTQEKTGFQVKVLSPFGWAGLGLSIINPGTQGRRRGGR